MELRQVQKIIDRAIRNTWLNNFLASFYYFHKKRQPNLMETSALNAFRVDLN